MDWLKGENPIVFVVVVVVIYLIYRQITAGSRRRKIAEKMVSEMEGAFLEPHQLVQVDGDREMPDLDLDFYRSAQREAEQLGLAFLTDFEDETLSEIYPDLRTFVRCLTSPDHTIHCIIYHIRPRGKTALQQKAGLVSEQRAIEFETEFSDGSFLLTNALPLKANAFQWDSKLQVQRLPGQTSAQSLFQAHCQRLSEIINQNPTIHPIPRSDFPSMQASQNRSNQLRKAEVKHRGYLIGQREFERMLGQPLRGEFSKIFEVVRQVQLERGHWDDDAIARTQTQNESQASVDTANDDYAAAELIDPADSPSSTPGSPTFQVEGMNPEYIQSVREQIEVLKVPKQNPIKTLIILAISLIIFFQLGWFNWGLDYILWLTVVVFIHELGHYFGMKVFGYQDIKMFFLPMMGAAVSGRSHFAPSYKKALVSLLGPVPGILIALGLIFAAYRTDNILYREGAMVFLLINTLNLLPFLPLDGGRFMQEVLFSRSRHLEWLLTVLNGLLFFFLAWHLQSFLFGFLGFVNIAGAGVTWRQACIARELRQKLKTADRLTPPVNLKDLDIPDDCLADILTGIFNHSKSHIQPRDLATRVLAIWEKVHLRPPGIAATIGLLTLYLAGWAFALLGGFGLIGHTQNWHHNGGYRTAIVLETDDTGRERPVEKTWYLSSLENEIELSDDARWYHGRDVCYDLDGQITCEGRWNMGLYDGEWKWYEEGKLITVEVYQNDRLLASRYLEDGQWIEDPNSLEEIPLDDPNDSIRLGPDQDLIDEFIEKYRTSAPPITSE